MKTIIPSFEIVWVDIPYDAAIQKLLASAVAGNAPDIVNLSSDFLSKVCWDERTCRSI